MWPSGSRHLQLENSERVDDESTVGSNPATMQRITGESMPLHPRTFEYLKPNEAGLDKMATVREATKQYAIILESVLPDGPDKTYVLRKVREVGIWSNVAITREADGKPRPEYSE